MQKVKTHSKNLNVKFLETFRKKIKKIRNYDFLPHFGREFMILLFFSKFGKFAK